MSSKRLFIAMLGAVVLLIASFGGGAYQATKMLKEESDTLLELKLNDKVLTKQQVDLRQAKKDIAEYSDLEEITKSIIPQEKDQANTIAEITTHANRAGISLGVIEFPSSELGQVQKKGKKTVTIDSSMTQLTELEDIKGVYVMPIDVSNHSKSPVAYEQIIEFLRLLESNRRTAQVTNLSIRPDQEETGKFHFSITLNTYIRPQ